MMKRTAKVILIGLTAGLLLTAVFGGVLALGVFMPATAVLTVPLFIKFSVGVVAIGSQLIGASLLITNGHLKETAADKRVEPKVAVQNNVEPSSPAPTSKKAPPAEEKKISRDCFASVSHFFGSLFAQPKKPAAPKPGPLPSASVVPVSQPGSPAPSHN